MKNKQWIKTQVTNSLIRPLSDKFVVSQYYSITYSITFYPIVYSSLFYFISLLLIRGFKSPDEWAFVG